MKKKKKGFMLVETLIVSTFITTTLIFLFVQFKNINQGFEVTFKYNNIDDLYRVNEARKYILENGLISEILADAEVKNYSNLTNCPATMLNESTYCSELFKRLDVKTIILVKVPVTDLITYLNTNRDFTETFFSFIKQVKPGDELYRLMIEFNDDKYASLPISF